MKLTATLTVLTIISAGTACAGSRIDTLCGTGHVNEVTSVDDVIANPDGFYIRSLQTQLSHGDPRIILATGDKFHICTRSTATPDMSANLALQLVNERTVKFLFVPISRPDKIFSS